jgi:ribosomal protein S18 acetylase RimI-like enzyme
MMYRQAPDVSTGFCGLHYVRPRNPPTPHMSIRPVTVSDIPQLFLVRPRTRENALTIAELRNLGITPESVAGWLESSTSGWAWEASAGEVVGFCMADRNTCELLVIALLPEYEGRGIGGQLMQYAESWLAQSGCSRAWLKTDVNPSLRAYGFYRHRGWTDWKIEQGLRWMETSLTRL